MFSFFGNRLTSFRKSREANTAMIFALSAPVLMFGTAFAVDFTDATIVRSKLNDAADAAALAALTPAMMQQSDTTAEAAAVAMFKARAASISMLNNYTVPTPVITHPGGNQGIRNITVTYTAQANTIFSGILNLKQMNISGTSTAQASVPPNINFYLLLDNSPSMSLPSTTAGITSMVGYTPTQDGGSGCAFACHMAGTTNTTSPLYQSSDTMGNLCTDGSSPPYPMCNTSSGAGKGSIATQNGKQLLAQFCSPDPYCTSAINKTYSKYTSKAQMDNYAMARHYSIPLRLDELTSGVSTLLSSAFSYQTSGIYSTPPVYEFAAYSMDSLYTIGNPSNTQVMALTAPSTDYRSAWSNASANFGVMEMWANNATCNGSTSCTGPGSNGDVATNYDNALSSINATMPTPGNGTNVPGDKPQEVLFFVTDGVEDEQNLVRLIQPVNGNNGTNYCTQIKARGIKIAILYTEYLPVPTNAFYESSVAPFQPNIGTYLQACASPNLYYDAAIGSNLGTALSQLFQAVVQNASLSN